VNTNGRPAPGGVPQPARSALLDLLRGIAALLVALHHLRSMVLVARADLTAPPSAALDAFLVLAGFGPAPVIVFFVLSGYLVGGSLLRMPPEGSTPAKFLLGRVTRLWLVMVPAFALTVCLPGADLEDRTLGDFAANLAFLQNIVSNSFGGNFPLWSLGTEFWCYVLFLTGWMAWLWRGPVRRFAILAGIGLLLALPSQTTCYLPLWLLGTAVHFLPSRGQSPITSLITLGLVLLGMRLFGVHVGEYTANVVIGISTAWAIHSCIEEGPVARFLKASAGLWARLAAFSFSLYVLHIPLFRGLLPWLFDFEGQAQPSQHSMTILCASYAL